MTSETWWSRFSGRDRARFAIELLAAVVVGVLASTHGSTGSIQSSLSTLAGVSGVLIGALITGMAILAAMPESPFVANLRKNGKYSDLVDDLFYAVSLHFVALIVVVSLIFTASATSEFIAVGVAISLFAGLRTVFAAERFRLVLSVMNEPG